MQSHLTVSYASQTPATGTTAGTGASADAPAADSPLGFLAALIDQLLAGSGTKDGATSGVANTLSSLIPDAPAAPAPAPAFLDLTNTLQTSAATPPGADLLATLNKELDALKAELDAGQQPDADLLKKLGDTANAIAAMIAVPNAPAAPTANPDTTLDPLATITSASQADAPSPAGTGFTPSAPLPLDQATLLLASLGITPPSGTDGTTDTSATTQPATAQPLPAVTELVTKLSDLVSKLAPVSPETAQKLQALTDKLTATEANPQLLTQLAGPSDPDGTALDSLLKQILSTKPAEQVPAAPKLSVATLPVPEILTPVATKTASVEPKPAAQPSDPEPDAPAPTTPPPPALKVATATKAAPADDAKPKLDAKIVASVAASVTDSKPAPTADTPVQSAAAAAVTAPTTTDTTSSARVLPAAYQAVQNPINMGQVAFEIVRQMHQGTSRFSIRLDPPELGRVDVRMHVDQSGAVSARLTVERSETLDMFQRDRGSLEKALSQAGLDANKTNLEFSLKQQNNPFAGMAGGDQRQQSPAGGARYAMRDDDDAASTIPAITLYRGTASAGGVNLFV